MSAKPLTIGDRTFPTRDAAEKYIQPILHRYEPRTRIIGDGDAFLRDLFELHPLAKEKLNGREISHFETRYNRYGTRSLVVVVSDGQKDDFSHKKCLKA